MNKILVSFFIFFIVGKKEGENMKKPIILTGIALLIGMGISYKLGENRGEENKEKETEIYLKKEAQKLKEAQAKEKKALKNTNNIQTFKNDNERGNESERVKESTLKEPERIVFDHYKLFFENNRFLNYENNPTQPLTKEQIEDYLELVRVYWNDFNQLQNTNYEYNSFFLVLFARTTDYYGAVGQYFQKYEHLNDEQRKLEWEKVKEQKKKAEDAYVSFEEQNFFTEDK